MKKDRKKRLLRIARRAKERREARHVVTHGKLSMSASGFGFVTPPPGDGGVIREDIFIPPQFIRDAVDGDEVKVELLPPREEFGSRSSAGKNRSSWANLSPDTESVRSTGKCRRISNSPVPVSAANGVTG